VAIRSKGIKITNISDLEQDRAASHGVVGTEELKSHRNYMDLYRNNDSWTWIQVGTLSLVVEGGGRGLLGGSGQGQGGGTPIPEQRWVNERLGGAG